MHFIKESFHRKPLESKALVYCRGATAFLLGLSFIGFCIYLISQVLYSRPILQLSTENIDLKEISPTPAIRLCSENSSLTIATCRVFYENSNDSIYVPNCQEALLLDSPSENIYKCYGFHLDKALATVSNVKVPHESVMQLIVYWKINNLSSKSYMPQSVHSIELVLIDPDYSRLNPTNIDESDFLFSTIDTFGDAIFGIGAVSLTNYALKVSYHPQQYRLLKSYKLGNVFGLRPDFLDFNTFAISTTSIPLQSDEIYPDLARELYDGLFVLRKDARIREIKTEVMQHTVLSSIALAGGGYSVLTGIYVLLFGMSKVSPWGIAHIIPMYIKRKQQSKKNDEENDDSINEKLEDGLNSKKRKRSSLNDSLLPHILGARNIFKLDSFPGKKLTPLDPTEMSNLYSNVSESISQEASFMLPTHIDIDESNTVTKSVLLNNECETSSKPNNIKENQDSKELIELRKETAMLATEMKELKIILSEYFIDTKYMDQLRFKKKPTSSSDDPELIFN